MKQRLNKIYRNLYSYFGPQYWWPADSSFEVIVGAILTQSTNWQNVEKAVANLKRHKILNALSLHKLRTNKLASLIKPAGYFNIKAARLKEFLKFFFNNYNGKIINMRKAELPGLRLQLLSVGGIGPETADSILLYALNKPSFVVDAYTRRILLRHGFIEEKTDYHEIQNLFMKNLKNDVKLYNEYHALLVKLGKEFCLKSKPRCSLCPLKGFLQ